MAHADVKLGFAPLRFVAASSARWQPPTAKMKPRCPGTRFSSSFDLTHRAFCCDSIWSSLRCCICTVHMYVCTYTLHTPAQGTGAQGSADPPFSEGKQ